MVVLLTGVGTRYLNQVIETRFHPGRFVSALKRVAVVVRGPKPMAVMREWGIPVAAAAPEPNTWRELLEVIRPRPEKRVAVQEYGKPNPELIAGLEAQGRDVTRVPVYQWGLPEDLGPLREAIRGLAAREFAVVLFTTATQLDHLLQIAAEDGLEDAVKQGLDGAFVGSIGPTTSETLREHGIRVDLEPSHPKMGILLAETAARFS
jgi:uroporphyrinogen-III synthase